VAINASPSTRAGIAIVPGASRLPCAQWLERRQAELLPEVEYFHVVFTLPEPIAALAYQNKKALTTSCFAPAPRPCARSPLIRNTWVPRSASSRSCTPGCRNCTIIRTCNCVVPAAVSPRTASTGSLPPGFSCRAGPLAPVPASVSRTTAPCLRHGCAAFLRPLEPLATHGRSPPFSRLQHRLSGWSTRSLRSATPDTCSTIWPLHPSRGHLQQPADALRRRRCHLPVGKTTSMMPRTRP